MVEYMKDKKKKPEEMPEELRKLLEEIQELSGDDPNINFQILEMRPTLLKKMLVSLIAIILHFALLVSLTGFIKWVQYEHLYQVLLLGASFGVMCTIVDIAMERLFKKITFLVFGANKVLLSIISLALLTLAIPGVAIISTLKMIFVFVVNYATVSFIKSKLLVKIYAKVRK